MAVSNFQFKKMEEIGFDLIRSVGRDNSKDIDGACEIMLSSIPIEVIATATGSESDKLRYSSVGTLSYFLLSSEKYAGDFLSICEINGSYLNLYNSIIDTFDGKRNSFDFYMNDVLKEALSEIILSLKDNHSELKSPVWDNLSADVLEVRIKAIGSFEQAVKTMGPIEIAACSHVLKDYGYPMFEGFDRSGYYPYKFFKECNREEMRPLYNLLAELNDDITAQRKLDTTGSRLCFLPLKYIERMTKGDSAGFIDKAVRSKLALYDRPLELLVSALRDENRLHEIDSIKKSTLKKLLSSELINYDDFVSMPKASSYFKRERLSSDLQL